VLLLVLSPLPVSLPKIAFLPNYPRPRWEREDKGEGELSEKEGLREILQIWRRVSEGFYNSKKGFFFPAP
jgi:hypothetical protein